jgi:hypothetical protein
MPSREEKLRYLSHHLSYELLMLRYTYARLHDTSHKLMWNAFLEAFAVYARNLQLFLMNDKDSRNYRVGDYNPNFPASKPPVKIKDKIAVYIVHPGKARSEEGHDKFDLERADKAYAWIEHEFARFIEGPPSDGKTWHPELADPNNYKPDKVVPDACTHPLAYTLTIPQQSHTSHIANTFVWQFPKGDK